MKIYNMLICVSCFCVNVVSALNQDYDPHWTTNDSWQVRVSYSEGVYDYNPSNVFPRVVSANSQEIYRYSVVNVNTQFDTVTIRVDRPQINPDYAIKELTYGRHNLALRKVVQYADTQVRSSKKNPYGGNEAWLFVDNYDDDYSVIDFPLLPSSTTNENRIVYKKGVSSNGSSLSARGTAGAFLQNINFGTNCVVISMVNPTNGIPVRQVTFLWERNAKWWKTVKVTSGTNVEVTATLIE